MDIVIYGYSDNLDKNYVSPPLSLYPLCTVPSLLEFALIKRNFVLIE